MIKSIFFLLWAVLLIACSTQKMSTFQPLALSSGIIQFHEVEKKNYAENSEGSMMYAIRLAERFYEEGIKNFRNCTDICYEFFSEKILYIFPVITFEEKISLLEKKVEESYFATRKLTEKEAKEMETVWTNLLRAEHYLLYSELTIAEIMQAYSRAISQKKVLYQDSMKSLDFLPTVSQISLERNRIESLKALYRQLLVSNYQLSIPTWEKVYEEDHNNHLIEIKER